MVKGHYNLKCNVDTLNIKSLSNSLNLAWHTGLLQLESEWVMTVQ